MRYIIVVLGLVGLILLLKWQFPYALTGERAIANMVYLVGFAVLIMGGSWASGRYTLGEAFKYALVWLAIIFGLIVLYTHREKLYWSHIRAELFPNQIRMTMGGALSVKVSADGHFHIEAQVNDVPVDFIVDTGAADIVLSPGDARRAGFDLKNLDYTRLYSTANGTGAAAPIRIKSFQVGYAMFQSVPASVNSAPMENSLLGMFFLQQFKSYHVDGDTLTLYP